MIMVRPLTLAVTRREAVSVISGRHGICFLIRLRVAGFDPAATDPYSNGSGARLAERVSECFFGMRISTFESVS